MKTETSHTWEDINDLLCALGAGPEQSYEDIAGDRRLSETVRALAQIASDEWFAPGDNHEGDTPPSPELVGQLRAATEAA